MDQFLNSFTYSTKVVSIQQNTQPDTGMSSSREGEGGFACGSADARTKVFGSRAMTCCLLAQLSVRTGYTCIIHIW